METFIRNHDQVTKDKFNEIADKLLNGTVLLCNGVEYRLCEIEFYLRDEKEHNDEYTHCNPEQSKYGQWYFHKFHNGSLKSGTFKGLDLTLGDGNYCGILIRSVYKVNTKQFIEGPCNTVDAFRGEYNVEYKDFFTPGTDISVLDNSRGLVLKDKLFDKESIYCGPRIGLSDKYPEYKTKSYRYAIYKSNYKKKRKELILLV